MIGFDLACAYIGLYTAVSTIEVIRLRKARPPKTNVKPTRIIVITATVIMMVATGWVAFYGRSYTDIRPRVLIFIGAFIADSLYAVFWCILPSDGLTKAARWWEMLLMVVLSLFPIGLAVYLAAS